MPALMFPGLVIDRNHPIDRRLPVDRYFEVESPKNGQIISSLVQDLLREQAPKRLLFVRTPTTGAWLESIPTPADAEVVWMRYADPQQPRHNAYTPRETYVQTLRLMAERGERFDMIVIDPMHHYAPSLEDFSLCLAVLAQSGVLLSHDCAPSSPDMASSVFTKGNWCGQTYAALVATVRHHPNLRVQVLDTDTGIAIVRWADPARVSARSHPLDLRRHWQQHLRHALQSLIDRGEDRDAFSFFRRHGAAMVGLRHSRRIQARRFLAAVRRKLMRVLGRVPPANPPTRPTLRKDLTRIAIQKDACLLAFHKALKEGQGAALSLYIYDKEVLKFDLFGGDKGHFHVAPREAARIFMAEQTVQAQMQRAIFEIGRNAQAYLSWNPDPAIQAFKLDQQALQAALAEATPVLLKFETIYEATRTGPLDKIGMPVDYEEPSRG